MSAATRAPVFVVGTPRSGTTLTAQILDRHPTLLMPGELHFFEDVYARQSSFGDLSQPSARARCVERMLGIYGHFNQALDQERIEALFADAGRRQRLESAAVSYRGLLDEFMAIQVEAAGKQRWGNNTPKDIFHVPQILELYPQARFVVCVRDVRDFMLSYKGRWRVSAHGDRLQALYHPITTAMLWRATAKLVPQLAADLGPAQLHVVTYEELVGNPERTVRDLCRFLDLDFSPDMLEVDAHNSSSAGAGSGIFTSSVGRWRSELEPEEIYLAQRIAGPDLSRLGYPLVDPDIRWSRLLGHVASFPWHAAGALWANRAHRGPTLPYLWRRITALIG